VAQTSTLDCVNFARKKAREAAFFKEDKDAPKPAPGGGAKVSSVPQPQTQAQFTAQLSGKQRCIISSHSGGVPERFTVLLGPDDLSNSKKTILSLNELDKVIGVLVQMREYIKP